MRLVIVSGIYPPDIGGPATHAAALYEDFRRRGHETVVLTLWDGREKEESQDVVRFPRHWALIRRLLAVSTWLMRHRDAYDVVYATGMQEAAVMGGRLARRRVVIKIVGDPAWERSIRHARTSLDFDQFQVTRSLRPSVAAMKWARTWAARNAARVTVPSLYLKRAVDQWLRGREEASLVRNGARIADAVATRDRHDGELRVLFVGRLVKHKRLDVLVEAIALSQTATLTVVGDGPDLERIEDLGERLALKGRVKIRGSLSHDETLAVMRTCDVLALASEYEGLPHVVIEALSLGLPVVSSAQPGTLEAIEHRRNGWVVGENIPQAYASVFDTLASDKDALIAMSDAARTSAQSWSLEKSFDRLEAVLLEHGKGEF